MFGVDADGKTTTIDLISLLFIFVPPAPAPISGVSIVHRATVLIWSIESDYKSSTNAQQTIPISSSSTLQIPFINQLLSRKIIMTNSRQHRSAVSSMLLLFVAMLGTATSFAPSVIVPTDTKYSNNLAFCRQQPSSKTTLFAFQQLPGESNSDFFKRISSIASDTATFERMVREQQEDERATTKPGRGQPHRKRVQYTRSTYAAASTTQLSATARASNSTSTGYRPVEEWDAEQKEKAEKGEQTWEQRAQFDGQRYGNQYRQNEILRHHLNTF